MSVSGSASASAEASEEVTQVKASSPGPKSKFQAAAKKVVAGNRAVDAAKKGGKDRQADRQNVINKMLNGDDGGDAPAGKGSASVKVSAKSSVKASAELKGIYGKDTKDKSSAKKSSKKKKKSSSSSASASSSKSSSRSSSSRRSHKGKKHGININVSGSNSGSDSGSKSNSSRSSASRGRRGGRNREGGSGYTESDVDMFYQAVHAKQAQQAEVDSDQEKPSRDLAKERGEKLLEGKNLRLSMGPNSLGNIYGPGIGLYFVFIKWTSVMFLITSLLMIYNMYDNAKSGGDWSQLGDTYVLIFSSTGWNWLAQINLIHHFGGPVRAGQGVICVIVMALFFVFGVYFLPLQRKSIIFRAQQTEVLVEDYTLYVRGLPADSTVAEVSAFFQQFGTVLYVDMPLRNRELLLACREREISQKRVETWVKKERDEYEKTKHESACCCTALLRKCGLIKDYRYNAELIETLDKKIANLETQNFAPTGTAFVTYEYMFMADAALINYTNASTWFLCFQLQRKQPNAPFFRDKFPLRVERAADPTNVMWENLQYNRGQRILREVVAFIISLGFIALISYIVVLLYGLRTNYVNNIQGSKTDKFGVVENTAGAILGVLVVITNTALVYLLMFFTSFEQHHQRDDVELMLMIKLTVAQIANFLSLMFSVYGAPWVGPDWYNQGARLLFTLLITDSLKGSVINIVQLPIIIFRFLGGCTAASQYDMDVAYRPEPFLLAEQYASMNKTIFLSIVFMGAMPVAPVVAVITFFLKYWVDRYTLMRRNATPLIYDDDMAEVTEYIFPIAIIVQGVFTCLLYRGSPDAMTIVAAGTAVVIAYFVWQQFKTFAASCCSSGSAEFPPGEVSARSYLQFWRTSPYTSPLGRDYHMHKQTLHWRAASVHAFHSDGNHAVARVAGASLETRMENSKLRAQLVEELGDVLGKRCLIVAVEGDLRPIGVVTLDIGLAMCWRISSTNATDRLTGCAGFSKRQLVDAPMTLADLRVILQRYPGIPKNYWFRVPGGTGIRWRGYGTLSREDEMFKLAADFLPLIILSRQETNIIRRRYKEKQFRWVDDRGIEFGGL